MTTIDSKEPLTKAQKDKFTTLVVSLLDQDYEESEAVELATSISKSLTKSRKKPSDVQLIKAEYKEQQITVEVIYEPNVPDSDENWMTAETIAKARDSWEDAYSSGVAVPNLYHALDVDSGTFSVNKTWIVDDDSYVGDVFIQKGTWVGEFHYSDLSLWNDKKAGVLGGISLGAKGSVGVNDV